MGQLAHDDFKERKEQQMMAAKTSPALTPLAQEFSITNDGKGDCTIVVHKGGVSRVVSGDCRIQPK